MDSNNDIIELLDILYGMVNEAWGVPLGNDKCIIEREKAIEIINEIKAKLPSSVAEAQRLVAARDEFIGNAKREAEAMRKNAEEKSRAMVEEQEIVRVARQQSTEMIRSAEIKSKELRRVASEYVEDIMRQTEEGVSAALATLQSAHSSFRALGANYTETTSEPKQAAQSQPRQEAQPAKQQSIRQSKPAYNANTQQVNPPRKQERYSTKVQTIQREED